MRPLADRSSYLNLAGISPALRYDYAESMTLSRLRCGSAEIIAQYFHGQPAEYREELRQFSKLNSVGSSPSPRCWIFVPCYNEDRNLSRIVQLFDRQLMTFGHAFELCFIVNCPEGSKDYARLIRSLDILLRAKEHRPHIHIISKVFSLQQASLGRARKYGFDYCLQRISEQSPECAENSFIVCVEGDTLAMPDNFLKKYAASFSEGSCKLVQGKVAYPEKLLKQSEVLRVFTAVREAVHEGQGKYRGCFPEFDGLMPCGRNFAVSPSLYVRVGGIDPLRRPGPEDDIILGSDIVRLVGEDAKEFSEVPLTTSPRREVLIIRDMLLGEENNLKRAYANFHDTPEIRDFETADIEHIVAEEFPRTLEPLFVPTLLSQLYQWVVSTCLKGAIAEHADARRIKELYRSHQLGYWEKERKLWNYGRAWLWTLPLRVRSKQENDIADEALFWFQHFNYQQGMIFRRDDRGILSRLIEPQIWSSTEECYEQKRAV